MPHPLPSSCASQSIEPNIGAEPDPVLLFGLAAAFTQAVGNPATALAASLGSVRKDLSQIADRNDNDRIARALDRSSTSAGRIIVALQSASALLRNERATDTIALPGLIRSVADKFTPSPKIARLVFSPPQDKPTRVIGDQRHIERILREMLAHALHRTGDEEASPPTGLTISEHDGEVWFALSWQDASLPDTERQFSLEPMPPDVGRPGALGIARALAVANDGRLWAEAIDGGIRLTCALPAQRRGS